MKTKVDLIVYNSKVYICDDRFSTAESFVVSDGKIQDYGSYSMMLSKYTASSELDGKGKYIYPGFYDAHCHFLGYGINKSLYADLSGAASENEVIERLLAFKSENPQYWIQGRGWDQNLWEAKEFPDKSILDSYFPDNPVYLIRVDGHAAWVNSKALELAGIDINTQVSGGLFMIENGSLKGILIDAAMELVRSIIPEADRKTKINALLQAQSDCFKEGITSVADAGLAYEDVLLIDSLQKSNNLLMRIYAMLEPSEANINNFVKNGIFKTDRLNVRSIKLYADGALGSRGACLLSPYSDNPSNSGIMINDAAYLLSCCEIAKEYGYQVCVHAIGDSANRQVLNIYASLLHENNDLRWRIEHAQVIHPDDFKLFGKYNIIPSVQTKHATSDMNWAMTRLGNERIKYAYAYKKLLEQNGWLCNGTDFPIEDISPIMNFYAAVIRKDAACLPEEGFQTENALSRKDALLSMTLWAAKAAFEENEKGSLEKGKWADFIILDNNLMEAAADSIPLIQVITTYSAGQCIYNQNIN
ncbi:MAG: amidohydrolase [Bacteroidales bacterium]|nr:amidohydrolase [Bacteroidales bacterium]